MRRPIKKTICLAIYYGIAYYLPDSYSRPFGAISNKIRVALCKRIFLRAGDISTICKKVSFGSGKEIVMGDKSGLGTGSHIAPGTVIGNHVMMGAGCLFLASNHCFESTAVPMCFQGMQPAKKIIIEDDVWIGSRCVFTPGRHIKKGTIIGVGACVTKDFPEYSIIGGNPARLIRSRR